MTLKNRKQEFYKDRQPLHCYNLKLLDRRRLELGYKVHTVVGLVKKKYKEKAVRRREVYYIFNCEREFPNPAFVKQIADVLDISMADLVIENPMYKCRSKAA